MCSCLRLDYGRSTPGLGPSRTSRRAVAAAFSRALSCPRVQALSRVKPSSCSNSNDPLRLFHFHSLALHITTRHCYRYPSLPAASLDCAVLLDNYSTASLQQNHLTGRLALCDTSTLQPAPAAHDHQPLAHKYPQAIAKLNNRSASPVDQISTVMR
jgi:hypothetical protein